MNLRALFLALTTALASSAGGCSAEDSDGASAGGGTEDLQQATNRIAGSPCVSAAQCASNGGDAICFDEITFGQPHGSCSEACRIREALNSDGSPAGFAQSPDYQDDCFNGGRFLDNFNQPGRSICVPNFDGALVGKCQPLCRTSADCRNGYACTGAMIVSDSMMVGICEEACTSNAQCPATGQCNPFQGISPDNALVGTDGTIGGECI